MELILRIFFSLLVVFGLMWGLARLARRPLGGRGTGPLHVVARVQLARNSSVAVVQVVDKALVLGVTDGQVSLLGETDLEAVQAHHPHPPRHATQLDPAHMGDEGPLAGSLLSPKTWKRTLDALRDRTSR